MKGRFGLKGFPHQWITLTLLISIFPVIIFGSVIYYMGAWIVNKEIHRASQESLIQVRSNIEIKLRNIEQITSQLSMQSTLIELMNMGNEPPLGTAMQTNRVRDDLTVMKNGADEMDSVYFYHLQQQVVISNTFVTSAHDNRVLMDRGWMDDVDRMIQKRQQRLWITPRVLDTASGPVPVMTYIVLLPLFYDQVKGAIVVNLRQDFLEKSISQFPMGSDGKLIIMDKDRQIIAGQLDAEPRLAWEHLQSFIEANEKGESVHTGRLEGTYVSVVQSGFNGWIYAMVIPADTPRHQVDLFRQVIILISAVLCVLAVCSGYFTHKRLQNMIHRIMDKLSIARHSGPGEDEGELQRIEKHINGLLEEINSSKSRQETHFSLLRTHYLHSCIHGNVVEMLRLSDTRKEWELFPHSRFCVLAVQMDALSNTPFEQDQSLFLFAVSNIARELPVAAELMGKVQLDSIIVHPYTIIILNYDGKVVREEQLEEYAGELCRVVRKILKHTITVGIGTCVGAAELLVQSYREALAVLHMNWTGASDGALSRHNMTAAAKLLVQYPIIEEREILRAVMQRDREAVLEALLAFRSRLELDAVPLHLAKTFYLQLLVAAVSLVQEYDEDLERIFGEGNPYEAFFPLSGIEAIHKWLAGNFLDTVISFMESVSRNRTDVLIQKTIALIQDKYTTDLSLQSAADAVNISASYLSKLFKEATGQSFVEYVTEVRMKHAVALLEETELTLNQISEAIGYTSVQQLFRVFRKRFGLTPGEYRERQGNKEESGKEHS